MRGYRDQNAGCAPLCPNPGVSTFSAIREAYARRARFLSALAYRRFAGGDRRCPYCLGRKTAVVGRKFVLMEVRRCADCGLMFRWPKDSDHINYAFYQGRYIEPPATDMPQESKLDSMMASNFSGTMHDRSAKLAVLKAVKAPPARVLDFGCSWGYAPYQLSQAGYSVTGFEISRPRADFGRKGLGVKIVDTYREPTASRHIVSTPSIVIMSSSIFPLSPVSSSGSDACSFPAVCSWSSLRTAATEWVICARDGNPLWARSIRWRSIRYSFATCCHGTALP